MINLLRLKELEIKQKELDRKAEQRKENKVIAIKSGIIISIFGIFLTLIGILIHNENITIMGVVLWAVVLWLGVIYLLFNMDNNESNNEKEDTK